MKIAVDKDTIQAVKNDGNEYIYLFNDEEYNDLVKLNMRCIRYDKCNFIDINLTDYDINCIKKAKPTDKDYNKIENRNYKFAIIVPNYNYAHTLEKCLNSILNQTYKNYEIIFVDDVSTDNSLEIAERLLKPPHKIIPLKQKRLNGGARNEAYLHISKDVDYVWYVDSDDWLDNDYVLENINKKLYNNPDVLFLAINVYRMGRKELGNIPKYKDRYQAFQGWSGSCGKVIKKSLATRPECLYNEGTLKEDKNQHCRICIYMDTFDYYLEPVYVWNRENIKSVTTVREKVVWGTSTIRQWADTLQLYLSVKGQDKKMDSLLEARVRKCKEEVLEGKDRQY